MKKCYNCYNKKEWRDEHALQRTNNASRKKKDFLFSSKPYNEDIDINQVAAIQDFYEKNCYIKEEDIPTFLNW